MLITSIVSTLSLLIKANLSPLRIMSYSSGKSFRACIIKFSSEILPFSPSSLIQIWSPSKSKIYSSESFSFYSNLLFWNSLLSFNKDEAAWKAYLLTCLSHASLQFLLGKFALFILLTNPKAILPTEELVLIDKIKSSHASSLNSSNFMMFLSRAVSPLSAFSYSF